ncbi:PTS sugar transporter subunit IIA domain-containing protein [Enterococcus sp. LJL120]
MIGFIVTGHGSFAPGLVGAIEMIAGEQTAFRTIPFLEGENIDAFEEKMKAETLSLLDETEGVIIFSDLLGGSPFRAAMLAAADQEKVEVVAGTNLPMLIEGVGMRSFEKNLLGLLTNLLETGKAGMVHAQLQIREDEAEEEGI